MDPYPLHYTHRPRSTESTDPSIRTMIDELQQIVQRLGEKVEGRCNGLETRVTLEMSRAEADVERTDLDKHVSDLALEVTRLNRFMERETMAHPHGKSGILSTTESASARPMLTAPVDGPEGHR
jgi:hypothetical protein